jgi:predicted MFS family arabinose efflux permease
MNPYLAAAVGFASLAAAMGIGRFAFTPLLPLMQADFGLTLAQGAWLATANYLGYLVGAVACVVAAPRANVAARWGLAGVALTTAPMALTASMPAWLVLRFVSGAASALVLVGISGWALSLLAAAGRGRLGGGVFAGVGSGIVLAGVLSLAAGAAGWGAEGGWWVLGGIAAAVAAAAWRPLGVEAAQPGAAAAPAPSGMVGSSTERLGREGWLLVACYGAFGLGYIVPATFIPALARSLVPDPALFGWAWPLFGLAAAVSTVAVSRFLGHSSPRRVWAASVALMAAGVLAPVVSKGLPALLACAILVGGTFMVATMAGMQEARRIAPRAATRLVAAMTAAFAVGQLAGPALVGLGASADHAIAVVSAASAALLLASAAVLLGRRVARVGATLLA